MSNSSLYQKRLPIFTRAISGKFRTLKSSILYFAYAVFFLLPWLPWQRAIGPQHAINFDLTTKRFYIFDLLVDVQNILWLAAILIAFAWLLFMITGILGRAFCGYFCFQTLWTDAFMKIEHWIQGDKGKRTKLYNSKWTSEKIVKVGGTWLAWLIFAFWSGFTFTSYWIEAPILWRSFFIGEAPYAAYVCTFLLTFLTFTMAGFAREQVCIYMCPYARFQSAMFDRDTLIISYDQQRGEHQKGRHKPLKNLLMHETRQQAGYGDCIDCKLCVDVCPTGIDIRDGLSYKCISCGLCIDACNTMMEKINYPRNLIRYASEVSLAGGKTRFFKLKTIAYALCLSIVIAILINSILHSPNLTTSLEQIRQPLATLLSDGRVKNSYELKLNNQTLLPMAIDVTLTDLPEAVLNMPFKQLTLKPGERIKLSAQVIAPRQVTANAHKSADFKFVINVNDDPKQQIILPAHFYGK